MRVILLRQIGLQNDVCLVCWTLSLSGFVYTYLISHRKISRSRQAAFGVPQSS